jgi:hypothetical protein
MSKILHDLRIFTWGYFTDHPFYRETRVAFTPCISVIKHPFTGVNHYRLRFPRLHILNAYEMEMDFIHLSYRGSGRCKE